MTKLTFKTATEWIDSNPNPFLKVSDVARHFNIQQSNIGFYLKEHEREALKGYISVRRSHSFMQFIIDMYQIDSLYTLALLCGLKEQSIRNQIRKKDFKWFNTNKLSISESETWSDNLKVYKELFSR